MKNISTDEYIDRWIYRSHTLSESGSWWNGKKCGHFISFLRLPGRRLKNQEIPIAVPSFLCAFSIRCSHGIETPEAHTKWRDCYCDFLLFAGPIGQAQKSWWNGHKKLKKAKKITNLKIQITNNSQKTKFKIQTNYKLQIQIVPYRWLANSPKTLSTRFGGLSGPNYTSSAQTADPPTARLSLDYYHTSPHNQ